MHYDIIVHSAIFLEIGKNTLIFSFLLFIIYIA